MPEFFVYSIKFIVVCGILYLFGAFVGSNFDFRAWDAGGRFLLVALVIPLWMDFCAIGINE